MSMDKVCVVGLGYIGLPTAAMFASRGKQVVGVDVRQSVVDALNQGKVHIVEPGLDEKIATAVGSGKLRAFMQPQEADAFILAVPTPFKGDGHQPDLSYVESATRSIASVLKKDDLVILESTSPVETTEHVSAWLAEERPDLSFPHIEGVNSDIRVAHCPERILPGRMLEELVTNDRIIGGITPACSEISTALYRTFVEGECIETNARTAEMCKLTENSFRDVNIAFANELSIICDKLDIDVWELIRLANHHPRVNILQPGPGVGGHCIAVDPWFIVSKTPDEAQLIHTARKVNDGKPEWVLNKVWEKVGEFLVAHPEKTAKDVTIACYGLAFKPDIDDLRESPALSIAKNIIMKHSGTVLAVEPNIADLPAEMADAKLVNLKESMERADLHVLLVDHKEFKESRNTEFGMLRIIDCRGIW